MNHSRDGKRRNLLILLTAMALAVGLLNPVAATAAPEAVPVVVTLHEGAIADPVALVEEFGGSFQQPLGIIEGFSAPVPSTRVAALQAHASVASVVVDGSLEILEDGWEDASKISVSNVDDYSGPSKPLSIAQRTPRSYGRTATTDKASTLR